MSDSTTLAGAEAFAAIHAREMHRIRKHREFQDRFQAAYRLVVAEWVASGHPIDGEVGALENALHGWLATHVRDEDHDEATVKATFHELRTRVK